MAEFLRKAACSAFLSGAMEGLSISEKEMVLMAAPKAAKDILQDLKILYQLRDLKLRVGDVVVGTRKQWGTLHELLEDLRSLESSFDEAEFAKRPGMNAHMAQVVRTHLPSATKHTHRTIAQLMSELTNNARECLKSGMRVQDVEDAWDAKLQEINYSFLQHHA